MSTIYIVGDGQGKGPRDLLAEVEELSKIETGRRGCNPSAARRLAGELGVDVAVLRVHPREQETPPAKPGVPRRRVSPRNLHRAYLGVLLGREVGRPTRRWARRR